MNDYGSEPKYKLPTKSDLLEINDKYTRLQEENKPYYLSKKHAKHCAKVWKRLQNDR